MKKLIPLFFLFLLFACTKHEPEKIKKDQLYFVSYRGAHKRDTTFIDKPQRVDTFSTFVSRVTFCNVDEFCGQVTKYYRNGAIDNENIYYQTNDLGIIYSLNIDWKSYSRLHSTNDSIDRRISEYIDHILSRSDFVTEADVPWKYRDLMTENEKLKNSKKKM